MASEEGVPVQLYIYDLTNGFASLLSPSILGRQIEGVWHTSVVVYEREYFYGAAGITSCAPGGTQLGAPHQTERLGETFVPLQVLVDYMQGLATTTYTAGAYRLLEHNCNHFSEEVAQFLCGGHVPKHIVQQPDNLLTPPQRAALQTLLDNLVPSSTRSVYAQGVRHSRQESPEYRTLNSQIEEARAASAQLEQARSTLAEKHARKERKREKKRLKHQRANGGDHTQRESCTSLAQLEQARSTLAEKHARKERKREKKRLKHQRANGGDHTQRESCTSLAQLEQARSTLAEKHARKERKREKKRLKHQRANGGDHTQRESCTSLAQLEQARSTLAEKHARKERKREKKRLKHQRANGGDHTQRESCTSLAQLEQARSTLAEKHARKERKREKKRLKHQRANGGDHTQRESCTSLAQLEQARSTLAEKHARKERKREKKRLKHQRANGGDHTQRESCTSLAQLEQARSTLAEKHARKERKREKKRLKHQRANGGDHTQRESCTSLAQLEQARSTLAEKHARKERKREKKRLKHQRANRGDHAQLSAMAEAVEVLPREEEVSRAGPSGAAALLDESDEPRAKPREPPIVYRDIDGAQEFERLAKALEKVELSEEERQSLEELQQYLVHGEGSWVLGDEFLAFIGRLLGDEDLSEEVRVSTLRSLAACALREDVSLLLHQDRRQHALLSYAQRIDARPTPEQRATALVLCNLFENVSSSEWLLYISEWEAHGQTLSNIRATTKVCVHSALSDDPELRELGTALMYNMATKEVKTVVFDEVCVELAMALLQLLQSAPSEEHTYRACAALARLAAHSHDVPQLVAIVGPSPDVFRGTSARIDEQIELIMKRVK